MLNGSISINIVHAAWFWLPECTLETKISLYSFILGSETYSVVWWYHDGGRVNSDSTPQKNRDTMVTGHGMALGLEYGNCTCTCGTRDCDTVGLPAPVLYPNP